MFDFSVISHKLKLYFQGEYIAPEKIENVYVRSKYVSQCYVYGESLKAYLIGVVVPDADVLIPAVASIWPTMKDMPLNELCEQPAVKKFIINDMRFYGKKAGLLNFEQASSLRVTIMIYH